MAKNYLKESKKVLSFIEEFKDEVDIDIGPLIRKYDEVNSISYLTYKKQNLAQKLKNVVISSRDGKIIANDRLELLQLMGVKIMLDGYDCDLNFIDVSKVKNFSELFASKSVVTLSEKFLEYYPQIDVKYHLNDKVINSETPEISVHFSRFNGWFNEWNFENGLYFVRMFTNSDFNNHPLYFDFKSGLTAEKMFDHSNFNQKFTAVNVNHLIMIGMFSNSKIKQNIDMDLSKHDLLEQNCLIGIFDSSQIRLNQLKNIKMPVDKDYSHLNFGGFVECKIFEDLKEKENDCDIVNVLKKLSDTQEKRLLGLSSLEKYNFADGSVELRNLRNLKSYANLVTPNDFMKEKMKLNLESYLTKLQEKTKESYEGSVQRKENFNAMFYNVVKEYLDFYLKETNDIEFLEKHREVLTSYNFEFENNVKKSQRRIKI